MQKGVLLVIGVLVGAAVIAYVLVNGMPKTGDKVSTVSTASPVATSTTTETSEPAAVEFTVEGKEFGFSPATLTVKEGDMVKVTYKNAGTMPHDFVIDEFSARTKVLAGGKEETVTFTASKKGTFEYYCSVGNHRARGMVGKLTVE